MPETKPVKTPLIFAGIGEVLFDVFEDGTETLGGAPLNFTVHAHQLASQFGIGHGLIISNVGSDRRGQKIIDSLDTRHMSSGYIGKDESHPTGVVSVFMKNGEPAYQIEVDSAWDYITEKPVFKELACQCSAICFGSLAQRNEVSRNTVRNFLKAAPQEAILLYDANLRKNTLTGENGYSQEIINYSCHAATIIKVNRTELFTMFDILGIACPDDQSLYGIRHRMEMLLELFPAQAVVVTRGKKGTIILNRSGEFVITQPGPAGGTAYPVGAGDACSAGILFGLTLGWDIHTTMELANRMGADVASHPAATPPLSDETLNFAQAHLKPSLSDNL